MADLTPKLEGMSVCLIGSFNPKIFHPTWLASEEIVPKEEADSADIRIVHAEISAFEMNRIRYEITRDRLVLSSTYAPFFKVVRDIVVGMFSLLSHTPINALGLNRDFHFQVETVERWHNFGHKMAPKEPWEGILVKPGMQQLAMVGVRPDDYKGSVNVQVAPSTKFQPGIYVNINDHYELKDSASVHGANEIIEMLKVNWEPSLERANNIVAKLLVGV